MYIAKLNDDHLTYSVKALRNIVNISGEGDDQIVTTSKPDIPIDWIEVTEKLAAKAIYNDGEGNPTNTVPNEILNYDKMAGVKNANTLEALKAAIVGLNA